MPIEGPKARQEDLEALDASASALAVMGDGWPWWLRGYRRCDGRNGRRNAKIVARSRPLIRYRNRPGLAKGDRKLLLRNLVAKSPKLKPGIYIRGRRLESVDEPPTHKLSTNLGSPSGRIRTAESEKRKKRLRGGSEDGTRVQMTSGELIVTVDDRKRKRSYCPA